ncbi:MAG: PEF-CTERM sorting domain-containing protein [Euryarchaeota archaeon]|nr:PEF-CTERM sorting domain-containing protein [Euryarchaeota archaeon]
MVKIGFIFGLLGLLLLANTCSAGLTLEVSAPDGISVVPGESISYVVTVFDDEIIDPEEGGSNPWAETVNLSINRTIKKDEFDNPDWLYTFDPSKVRLESSTDSRSSMLTLQVPNDAKPGKYSHNVEASAQTDFEQEVNITGRVIVSVINTDVNEIPEFPTIALPVAAVLGLVFVFGRRKE